MRVLPLVILAMLIAPAADAQLGRRAGPPAPRPAGPPLVDIRASTPTTWRDVADIRDRIEDGRDEGSLSRRDARRLKREANQIGTLADRYGVHGTSASEQRELDVRALVLRDQVGVQRTRGANNPRLGR